MFKFKTTYQLKIIAAFITGCFFLIGCENDEAVVKSLFNKKPGVEVGKDVLIKYSVGGKRKAVLTGPLLYRVQDTVPYIEFPNTLHVDFFNEHDSLESKLDAHYGKYKDTQSKVFLKDSVRVINIKGDTLYCDELYWDRNRTGTEFYTDKPVRIRTRTQVINGIGMDAKQDFTEWHIIQPVGIDKVPSSQFPQ